MTLGQGISFLHFKEEIDLNKFLFIKYMDKKKTLSEVRYQYSNSRSLNFDQILTHLGDIDYME